MNLALAASLLLGGCLLGLALRTEGRRRRAPILPPPGPHRDTTILLPVRNEEHNVVPCVDTLLAQTAQPLVRVIDDGSTDTTPEQLAARAAGEPRLIPLTAGPLADGWRGKVHALWKGSQGVESPWLLLTDADTRHHPEALARARAAAEARNLDAVSLAGWQEAHGAGENLLIPAVFAVLDALLGSWEHAAEGSSGPAVANGQFILLRREAWEQAGGFPSIRAVAMDDVAIARRLREAGGRTAFFRAPDLLRVRMYRGTREVVRGWRRILGALYGHLPGMTAKMLAVLLVPPLVLAAELLTGQWLAAALLWGAGAAASALLRAGSRHAPAWGLLYPCDAVFLGAVLALGVRDWRQGRLVSWKGREMRV